MADEQHEPTETGDDVRDCARCGGTMQKYTQPRPFGGFGAAGQVGTATQTYYQCRDCGHDTRYPNR